jgi:hypothetical protein
MNLFGASLPDAAKGRQIKPDDGFVLNRADAYEALGRAALDTFLAVRLVMTVQSRFVGGLHPLLTVMRSQKVVEEGMRQMLGAISTIYLLGSTETAEAAKGLGIAVSEQAQLIASQKQGSPHAVAACEAAAEPIGNALSAFRAAAQKDLGI